MNDMNMLLANNPNVFGKNLKIGQKLTVISEMEYSIRFRKEILYLR